jgi:hypothetical protein
MAALVVSGRTGDLEHQVAAGTGVVIALAFVVGSIRARAPHWLWLAGFTLLLSAGMYFAGTGYRGMNWMFLWVGLASAILGALRLRRFLQQNPKPEESGP